MPAPAHPPLSIVTFNLLAPCYKRLFHPSGKERLDREQNHPPMWHARLDGLLNLILTLSPAPDLIALQEVWFHPPFLARLEAALAPHFHIFYAKRPADKEDGLATLVRKRSPSLHPTLPPHLVHVFPLADSDRVGLAISVNLLSGPPLLVLNAHLTFPHCFINRYMRINQADALLRFVASAEHSAAPVLILGDMNGDAESPVCKRIVAAGFENCFASVNGPGAHPRTHLNHMKQQVSVDHVFLRPPSSPAPLTLSRRRRRLADPNDTHPMSVEQHQHDNHPAPAERTSSPVTIRDAVAPVPDKGLAHPYMRPVRTVVYPERFPTNVWPLEYQVSDHRPVGVQFLAMA